MNAVAINLSGRELRNAVLEVAFQLILHKAEAKNKTAGGHAVCTLIGLVEDQCFKVWNSSEIELYKLLHNSLVVNKDDKSRCNRCNHSIKGLLHILLLILKELLHVSKDILC